MRRVNLILFAAALLLAACAGGDAATSTAAPTATVVPATPMPAAATAPTAFAAPARRLQAGELILAADYDDIPAIFASDDLFVDAEAGNEEWEPDDFVIGLVVDGDARAYPVRLLSLHEIVNDTVGGRPVAVTWCPLCFSAIVFDRVVEGRELTFGVSGYLYRNNLVMYDHQSDTLWSQLLGRGIRGAHRNEALGIVPSMLTTWQAWREAQPATRVLSAARLGQAAEEVVDPYAGYYSSGAAGIAGAEARDERLKAKELVVGLTASGVARAYPLAAVRAAGLVQDVVGEEPLLLAYLPELQSVVAYRREHDGRTLTFAAGGGPGVLRDETTGTTWDRASGRALDGPLAGARLQRLAAPLVFWFAWSDLHPGTELYVP
jgi:hypothetical protein